MADVQFENYSIQVRDAIDNRINAVLAEVNVNELKLFMLAKSPDTQMTFDLVKIKEASKDNIVYYIQ